MTYRTLDAADVAGKRVLVRVDLNVPVHDGVITDMTRVERVLPTLRELAERGAKVVVLSHFDRPKGRRIETMSLRPVANALARVIEREVRFCAECVGPVAQEAVDTLSDGDIIVLENTRFHAGEEANDPAFTAALAALGDLYVNDAFSAAHRAHASTEGLAHLLPAFAGRAMQRELEALNAALGSPKRPVIAVVGGSKVSTKIDLLNNLVAKVDALVIGGAMANTFLAARGVAVGTSLQEPSLYDTARQIVQTGAERGCRILLPVDVVVSPKLAVHAASRVVNVDNVPADEMILDVGPATVTAILAELAGAKTLVWNGPLGAFEFPPFDDGTTSLAKGAALATANHGLLTVGGGGDTVSALRHAGVIDAFSYVSTAGGAFLEWMEGRALPGVVALG